MSEALRVVVLVVLLASGSAGWGSLIVRLFARLGWEEVRQEISAPLRLLLGMSLFLAVGGVLVALDVAYFGVLVAWHVVGVLLLAPRVVPAWRAVRAAFA